ncbi:hypothetical protein V6N13_059596 [Hibiscus sabdariffa]
MGFVDLSNSLFLLFPCNCWSFLKLCDSCESRLIAALKIFQVRAPSLTLVFKAVFRHKTYPSLIGHNEEYEAKRKQPCSG